MDRLIFDIILLYYIILLYFFTPKALTRKRPDKCEWAGVKLPRLKSIEKLIGPNFTNHLYYDQDSSEN